MEEPITLTGAIGIGNLAELEPDSWPRYFKQVPTRAVRVAGPFEVLVHGDEGGLISCKDGYIAVDARGFPYPIAADEFELIYGKQRRLDHSTLPPTTVHEIAVAHSFGTLSKDDAAVATRKLLVLHGLLGEDGGPA